MPHVTPSTPRPAAPMALEAAPGKASLMTLANAVAAVPACTDRLAGSTAATNGGGGRHSASNRMAKENMPAELIGTALTVQGIIDLTWWSPPMNGNRDDGDGD